MTIKSTPPISMTDIAAEFGGALATGLALMSYYRGGSRVPASVANVPASGAISLFDFFGTRKSVPGTMNYDTPGTYTFDVPAYATMSVEVVGAGGGGGSSCWDDQPANIVGSGRPGQAGGESRFLAVVAAGGFAGQGSIGGGRYTATQPPDAQHGGATGGTVNTPGGGAKGGKGGVLLNDPVNYPTSFGGLAGDGGKATIEYAVGASGAPTVGQKVTVTVGAGGTGGPYPGTPGVNGLNGFVHISWT